MKNLSILFLLGLSLGSTSGSINEITGKWLMHKVIQNGQDVTAQHNPNNERYISLNRDLSFESGGKPLEKNTGKYTFNEENNRLFIDSDAGPEDDSYWQVRINKDTMYWQGYGSEWAENFQIVHVRAIK